MALWGLPQGTGQPVDLPSITSNYYPGKAVVASSTTHTKGAWTELVATTSAQWNGFVVELLGDSYSPGTNTSTLLDIGIGGAGSEVVVLADVFVGYSADDISNGAMGTLAWLIPLRIPSGVRVAARCQSAVSSKSVTVLAYGLAGDLPCYGRATTYGTTTASSIGTAVTSGNGAMGSWTELVATTTAPVDAVLPMVGGNAATNMTAAFAVSQIGIGSAGAEQVVATVRHRLGSDEDVRPMFPSTVIPQAMRDRIPEGARLAGRAHSNGQAVDMSVIVFSL